MKIAYIGIDFLITALRSLLKHDCDVLEIFTCRTDNKTEFNTAVTAAANELSVPCHMERIKVSDFERLYNNGCELVVCAGYYHKIPVVSTLPLPVVNVHPSFLPIGRGAWPMPVTILKGLDFGGVTLHKMTEEMDMGDIILRKRFKVEPDCDLKGYMSKVDTAIGELIPRFIENFNELYQNAEPQGNGEYWACPTENDWTFTSEMNFNDIDRILRAFYGYECIYKDKNCKYELIGGKITRIMPKETPFIEIYGQGYITADSITLLN